jgi:glucose/arabinose dehydrogenase
MTKRIAFALLIAAACRGEADPPAQSVALVHHEIRADQLPPPFASQSAGNPPHVSRAPATWTPAVPPGFHISVFARDLDEPRNMILAPNGDILVVESSAGDIKILRGNQRFTLIKGLNNPFGVALRGDTLYIGDEDAVVRIPYRAGQTSSSATPERIASLPSGGHSTRNVIFNRDGSKMYVAIGSESNMNPEGPPRAAVTEYKPDGRGARTFAYGLRNPIGLAWNPRSGALWTCVNERDGLGDDLVPDYATDLRDGAFYGWPYSYIGQHPEPRRGNERRDLVAKAIVPSLLIQAHSAPINMVFYDGAMFPPEYRGSAFVALHGSWNRSKRTGYKVIRIPFTNGKPSGGYDDFVAGWMFDENSRTVLGRPAGLLVLADGSLLVSDDANGIIWRITYAK